MSFKIFWICFLKSYASKKYRLEQAVIKEEEKISGETIWMAKINSHTFLFYIYIFFKGKGPTIFYYIKVDIQKTE